MPLGPYRDPYTVVGLTEGMFTSSGDPVARLTLLDAQAVQFAVAPPLQRREAATGRSPLVTADINAVLAHLYPGVDKAFVARGGKWWIFPGSLAGMVRSGVAIYSNSVTVRLQRVSAQANGLVDRKCFFR